LISVFQAALHELPKAVAMIRVSDRVVVYANQRGLDMFAALFGAPNFVGQRFAAGESAAWGDDFERVITEQFACGATEALYETEARGKSGETAFVQATVTRLSDPAEGELWMTVVEDITAFKRAAVALEESNRDLADALTGSEQSFQRFVDSGMFGMFRGKLPPSPEAGVLQANRAFCELLGWSETEILNGALRAPAPIIAPENRPEAQRATEELRTRGFSALHETELVRKDGSRVPVLLGSALTSELDFVAIVLDRSDYKAKEMALRASQARFEAISTAGVIGVAVGTPAGAIIDINEACAQMIGYSREEFLARKLDFTQLTPPEWLDATMEARRQLRERGFMAPFKKRLIHRDGRSVPVLIAAVQLTDGDSLGLSIDLSEQERTEAALKATEEQLRQAQKMDAIGRLAGGVAHDFNNILSVILGYAEMIREAHAGDERVRADAEEIHRAATRAANLTKQLLLFTRQQVAETKVVDLNQTLSGMHNMLERLVGEDIELVTRAARRLGKVRADPTHLEQVVLNLVVNARDAMPAGGTLTLETCNSDGPGHDRVLLKVSDNGSGMDATTRARMFEPFFTTKEKDKGTGLGLSTVFGIVEQANGSISVESELGKGSSFTIALPRVDADLEPLEPGEPTRASEPGHETILLVEDEPEVRRIARKILEGGGYRVIEVSSPLAALDAFERERGIDVVITDVVMPQMNGVELIRRLQEKVRPGAPLRALCMSGYTDDETARHGLKEQRVPFLQKPFTPNSLRQKVREVLDGPPTRGSGEMAAVGTKS
jgi:two-component system cell cycle sensor histidine kinase/response regulator CckA